MTGVSTLMAPFLTPLLTLGIGRKERPCECGRNVKLSILWGGLSLPIVIGLVVKALWPKFTEKATDYLPALSTLAIAAIVTIVISANASKLLTGGLDHRFGGNASQHLWIRVLAI